MRGLALIVMLLASGTALPEASDAQTASRPGVRIYIISPAHGEIVGSPVVVKFGLRGMGVAPAGVDHPNTGHHHLLVDVDELPEAGRPVPADARHLHFGGGQTETTLELPAGRHRLRLLLGDRNHVPHDPPVVSEEIAITVE